MKNQSLIILIFALMTLTENVFSANNSLKELQALTKQLQKKPGNNTLRESIIQLAQKIKPAPLIPEEAVSLLEKGNTLHKEAQDATGYALSIAAYKESLVFAPWWGDAYLNLATALESATQFDEAISNLKLYALTINTDSADVREVQNKIYALEAKKEVALKSKQEAEQIVAGKGIGNITVGMAPEKLHSLLGTPSKSDSSGPWWQNYWWKSVGINASIKKSLNKVDSVQITAPANQFRTAEGVGLGTPEHEIKPKLGEPSRSGHQKNVDKKLYCYRTGLKLTVQAEKVSHIEVFRPEGFDETYCEAQLFE